MSDTRYNGWTNYETWNYGLWFDSDSNAELAQEAFDNAESDRYFTRKERARLNLADMLKEQFEEYAEQSSIPTTGIFADLLGASISAINWQEIAESLMSDVDTSEDTEDTEEESELA